MAKVSANRALEQFGINLSKGASYFSTEPNHCYQTKMSIHCFHEKLSIARKKKKKKQFARLLQIARL